MTRKKVARNLYRPLFGGEPHANVRIPRIIWYFHLSLLHNAYNAYMCSCMFLLSKGSHVQDPGPPSPGTRCPAAAVFVKVSPFLNFYFQVILDFQLPILCQKQLGQGRSTSTELSKRGSFGFGWCWFQLFSSSLRLSSSYYSACMWLCPKAAN